LYGGNVTQRDVGYGNNPLKRECDAYANAVLNVSFILRLSNGRQQGQATL
jgi:hypothetical protein